MARFGLELLELEGTGDGVLRIEGGLEASSTCIRVAEVLAPELAEEEGAAFEVLVMAEAAEVPE